ncbi:hypothetical protein QBC40DRAFT_339992 [Triangularia verruculosa]|uniref:DUF7924 domain-containing protein n=1 Tax=Triangularia verruculosa TaxID=2587418 RepID=A0AAN7AT59_9PEZI|nr:hypothetical protein QBC40DRAFT_339992 [Triangularia verruculosa]
MNNNRISKAQPRRSPRLLSKYLQKQLLDAKQPEVEGERAQPADTGKSRHLQHPKPKPPNALSKHNFILEWLESVGSDRDTHFCWSDSSLPPVANDDPIPREFTRSVPAMDSTLVGNPRYRELNLADNNIYIRPSYGQFPNHITALIDSMRRGRNSPSPTPNQVREDKQLANLRWGATEPEVEEYFRHRIFPYPIEDSLQRCDRQPMARQTVPRTGASYRVNTPVPDMLYGYNPTSAFPNQQARQLAMRTEMEANTQGLMYPFFCIEFKGEGRSGGANLWVATNQCLGASASCVNIAENLNRRLRQCESDMVHQIDSASFSIAMSGTEARLYVSWKQDARDYYLADVDAFVLQKPRDYIEFRRYVRNIIDWGRGRRLGEIRKSLDGLLEEGQRSAQDTPAV